MEIVGEYSDEGHSGKNIKGRQEFMRMLNDIEDGKDGVDFVLVFKLSRFGRNAADVLSSLQLMQDYGVNLICVEDGIDSSKEAGKLLISIIAAVAEIHIVSPSNQLITLKKSEAYQSVHHVSFILCYTVLYDFVALAFSLTRVRKLWWDDVTQGNI